LNQSRTVLRRVQSLLEQHQAVVLVRVAGVRGSTPRETGAMMMVGARETAGTIGGGELEHQAIQHARTLLEQPQSDGVGPHAEGRLERRYALGSNCGQCCGGVVDLAFEHLTTAPQWLAQTLEQNQAAATVAVFGAGHVGRAVVDVLAKLDVEIIWIDQRPEQFTDASRASLGDNVLPAPHPQPAAFAAQIPADSLCLVMTHSHSLDFDICTQLLARPDIPFCGLIGSQSKRRRFEGMLRQAGLEEYIPRLTCPIGIDAVAGKSPYEIAVSVSAQLLQQLSTQQHTSPAQEASGAAVRH